MRALKKIMAALALTAVLAGCSADNILSSIQGGKAGTVQTVSRPAVESAELQFTHPAAGDTIAVFDTSAGVFKAVLFSTEAPQAVQNFTTLAQQGFYNGLTFHRVIPNFMIQGGCPLGNGTGGPGWNIKGEFAANGVNNPIKHVRGVISMARSMNPNSAGSQFFIMHQDAPHLDGEYAAFGKVIEGMDVVNKIAEVRTDYMDKPLEAQVMKTVTVETFGVDYPEPETV